MAGLALELTYLSLWSGWWWDMWLRAGLAASHRCGFNSRLATESGSQQETDGMFTEESSIKHLLGLGRGKGHQ